PAARRGGEANPVRDRRVLCRPDGDLAVSRAAARGRRGLHDDGDPARHRLLAVGAGGVPEGGQSAVGSIPVLRIPGLPDLAVLRADPRPQARLRAAPPALGTYSRKIENTSLFHRGLV